MERVALYAKDDDAIMKAGKQHYHWEKYQQEQH